jgi:hypothetical protein
LAAATAQSNAIRDPQRRRGSGGTVAGHVVPLWKRLSPRKLAVAVVAIAGVAVGLTQSDQFFPDSTGGENPSPRPSCVIQTFQMPSASIAGTIDTPKRNARVAQRVDANGTIGTLPVGHTLWQYVEILVSFRPDCDSNSLIFPGSGPLTVTDGRWKTTVVLGTESTPRGTQFKINLVIVDADGRRKLEGYFQRGPLVGIQPEDLPGRLQVVESVIVTRQ